jgi:non-ribosomal peptide synthetase component E (peptide arylation enzyme)
MPPEIERISDYVDHYAKLCPGRKALVLDPLRWTYRDLAEQVDGLARALVADGIRKVDRVTLRKQALAEAEGRR